MNVKNFIIGGIVGGIVDFLLGWVFYGMLLKDTFPQTGTENMTFIFLGCMSFGFLLSFVFSISDGFTKCMTGLKAAAGIGLFLGLFSNFFANMSKATIDVNLMAIDILVTVIMSAIVGATIAVVNGKMK